MPYTGLILSLSVPSPPTHSKKQWLSFPDISTNTCQYINLSSQAKIPTVVSHATCLFPTSLPLFLSSPCLECSPFLIYLFPPSRTHSSSIVRPHYAASTVLGSVATEGIVQASRNLQNLLNYNYVQNTLHIQLLSLQQPQRVDIISLIKDEETEAQISQGLSWAWFRRQHFPYSTLLFLTFPKLLKFQVQILSYFLHGVVPYFSGRQ